MPADPGLEALPHTSEELGAGQGCEGSCDMDTERQSPALSAGTGATSWSKS